MNSLPASWIRAGFTATVVILISVPLSLLLNPVSLYQGSPEATFTGGQSCIECHQKEYRLWYGSDHQQAMSVATDTSVLGNFNNITFSANGKESFFYKKDGKFMVRTEGPGGVAGDFEISYTFGIRPLQQYLVPFDNGKYQCLPIAWNTEAKKWFHMAAIIYDQEELKPNSWLYWTNQAQNWNSMCAECHSTNLQKNFDPDKREYQTTWTDINVNCEACHGPGSTHIDWARLPELSRPQDVNTGLLVRTSNISSRQYVESCAYCHARRASIGEYKHQGLQVLDQGIPQIPVPPFYHIDGQILDEDYEYGSFTQSKMYMKDVRCGDCHDPHSLKRKFEGNALCTQCHRADEYDAYSHHRHRSKGETGTTFVNKQGKRLGPGDGIFCRDCHMQARYYMGIDLRYDHSFRVPRPDLSLSLGTPNTCTGCHDDKPDQWAAEWVNKWYGDYRKPHYATLLADAYEGNPGAESGLIRMINSTLYPEIIRAASINFLSHYRTPKANEAIQFALNDPDPLLRYVAVENLLFPDSAGLLAILTPVLNDPVRAVRMEAAYRLCTYPRESFNESQYRAFEKAFGEYGDYLNYVADFPSGRYLLGNYHAAMNQTEKAMENYREAISIDNMFYPAKINLGLLSYQQGMTGPAEALFQDLVTNHPDLQDGYYFLALLNAERNNNREAVVLLEKATTIGLPNPRLWYNLGLLYQKAGQTQQAVHAFEKGLDIAPCDFNLLYAMIALYTSLNNRSIAAQYLDKLRSCYPDDPDIQTFYRQF